MRRGQKAALAAGVFLALSLVVPVSASSNVDFLILHQDSNGFTNCWATGWHDFTASQNDRFRFGTEDLSSGLNCDRVKVRGRYWTDAPPYGWVTTGIFYDANYVSRTYYDAPAHDWSDHYACKPASDCAHGYLD
jgi:hypothetical protein